MPTWTNNEITIPYVYGTTATVPAYKYVTDCTGTTKWHMNTTFVTNEELKEQLKEFAESLIKTLQEMKYLNRDISEEEFMSVLLGDDENDRNIEGPDDQS